MFDASDWTIRWHQGGTHCIKRRSPYGPIRDLGELFFELAGSEATNEYFERRHSRCGHKIEQRHSGCRARPKNLSSIDGLKYYRLTIRIVRLVRRRQTSAARSYGHGGECFDEAIRYKVRRFGFDGAHSEHRRDGTIVL
jgi:hypothetical protein